MKRFILPLLILLFVGSLFAVESAPSEVVGYVKYECVTGLNLVALPLDQGYALTSEVGDAYSGSLDQISTWNSATQSWDNAVYYDFGDGTGMWDPDLAVQPGSVTMISALEPMSFYSIGDMPATNAQYSLVVGLNTLMVPLNKSEFTMTSELGDNITNIDGLSSWNSATQSWANAVYYDFGDGTGMWDPDFAISIGMPLMASALDTLVWPSGPRGLTSPFRNANK